jgi:hypothetical protein
VAQIKEEIRKVVNYISFQFYDDNYHNSNITGIILTPIPAFPHGGRSIIDHTFVKCIIDEIIKHLLLMLLLPASL